MNVEEFKEILMQRKLESVVKECMLNGVPYVFRNWEGGFDILRVHLCDNLGITSKDNIEVVGSARIGFCLDPDSFGRAFSDKSDIDVVVVDDKLFDEVWKILLKWYCQGDCVKFPSIKLRSEGRL